MTGNSDLVPNQQGRTRLALLLTFGCLLRLSRLGLHSLWYDEAGTLSVTQSPDLIAALSGDRHPPLSFLAFRAWFTLFGTSDAAMRALPALFSCVSLVLFAALARRWSADRGRLWAVALYACAPFLIFIAQEVRMYAFVELGTLIVLLATDWFVRAPRSRAFALLVIAAGSAFLLGTHYLGALACVAAVALGALAWRARRIDGRELVSLCVAVLAGLLAWTPWLVRVMPRQLAAPWSFQARIGTRDLLELPVRLVLVDLSAVTGLARATIYAFALLVALGLALHVQSCVRERRPGDIATLTCLLAPTLAALCLTLTAVPNFTPRYLTGAVPGLILCVSGGLASIRSSAARRALGTIAVVCCACVVLPHKLENRREDFRSACRELEQRWQSGDRVFSVTGTVERFSQAPLRHYLEARPEILASIGDFSAYARPGGDRLPHGARMHVVYRDAGYSSPFLRELRRTHTLAFEGVPRFRVQYFLFEAP